MAKISILIYGISRGIFRHTANHVLLVSVLLLIFQTKTLGQPGGGGGLTVGSFFDKSLNTIDILTDTSIDMRSFILVNDKIYQETFLFQTLKKQNQVKADDYGFVLPPVEDRNYDTYPGNESDQRLYIVHKQDTMILDLIGIMGENGAGYWEFMDSIVIQEGYFKYYRSGKLVRSDNKKYHRNSELMSHGFTPHTIKKLSEEEIIQSSQNFDTTFLKEENLPLSYFIKRAAYYYHYNQTWPALSDLEKALERNNGISNCEMLFLFTEIYTSLKQYEKAVEYVSGAINCRKFKWVDEWQSNVLNYKTRAGLYIKLGNYEIALQDFDSIYSISKNKVDANLDRANFKIKYLQDYQGAIHDLQTIISLIPEDHKRVEPLGWSEYSGTYFSLATAEYLTGNKKASFKHWLKAVEFGQPLLHTDDHILHFDSIINNNPGVPELYLARSLSLMKRGAYLLETGNKATIYFDRALKDLIKAKRLGLTDYRINMYRAVVYNHIKKSEEAMKEIDKAVDKNDSDPRVFLIRYKIRSNMGETDRRVDIDPDLVMFRTLLEKWKWTDY